MGTGHIATAGRDDTWRMGVNRLRLSVALPSRLAAERACVDDDDDNDDDDDDDE